MSPQTTFYDRRGNQVVPGKGAVVKHRRGIFALARSENAIMLVWPEFTKGVPELPGGGIEVGESDESALKREWNEETGLSFDWAIAPLKQYEHVRGFFAEDMNEFWIYNQMFKLFEFPSPVEVGTKWLNPEGDLAGWAYINDLAQLQVNRAHWLGITALLPETNRSVKRVKHNV